MGSGPQHPAILAEIRLAERSVNRWIGLSLLLLVAPLAPHITEEMWERTGHSGSIHNETLPEWDEEQAAEDEITLVVQVNGRLRDRIQVPASIDEDAAKQSAIGSEKVKAHTDGKTTVKVIYVPGRLVNIVVR